METTKLHSENQKDKDTLIEELINIQIRIERFSEIFKKRLKIKRYFFIMVSLFLITMALISVLDFVENSYLNILKGNEHYLLIIGIPWLLISIWALYRLQRKNHSSTKYPTSIEELKDAIAQEQEHENIMLSEGDSERRGNFFYILIIAAIVIYLLNGILKSNSLQSILNSEILLNLLFFLVFMIIFLVGNLIGSPMGSKKFYLEQQKFKNTLLNIYLAKLDASKINPRKSK